MRYIRGHGDGGCFFCEYHRKRQDRKYLIVRRGRTCFSILNRFPYNTGHLMIAPVAHKGTLHELDPDEMLELVDESRRMQRGLDRFLRPHGYNVGMNLGRVAGAGIPDHLHWHVVPRWTGDTNFMPAVGQTRVLPELLEETYRRLAPGLAG